MIEPFCLLSVARDGWDASLYPFACAALSFTVILWHSKAVFERRSAHSGGSAMTFDEVLAQVRALLQREKRVSYRALKVRFQLDDDLLEAVKDELRVLGTSQKCSRTRGALEW